MHHKRWHGIVGERQQGGQGCVRFDSMVRPALDAAMGAPAGQSAGHDCGCAFAGDELGLACDGFLRYALQLDLV